jgi:hypothetical protein
MQIDAREQLLDRKRPLEVIVASGAKRLGRAAWIAARGERHEWKVGRLRQCPKLLDQGPAIGQNGLRFGENQIRGMIRRPPQPVIWVRGDDQLAARVEYLRREVSSLRIAVNQENGCRCGG